MIFNKNRIVTILTVLSIQIAGGIGLVIAGPCDAEINNEWKKDNRIQDIAYPLKEYGDLMYGLFASVVNHASNPDGTFSDGGGRHPSCSAYVKSRLTYETTLYKCFYSKALESNCNNLDSLKFSAGSESSASSNNNTSSNQPTKSGASTSQSNLPHPSTQSENSQTNTNTQTTKSKKGKKNPFDVSAKCVKLNHDKTKIVNMCSFPINITFCMMHQDDQSIQVTNSCNDEFVTETVYPGRALSDETLNTRLFSTACKYPSVSQNNKYISFDTVPEGRCSQ